MSIANQQSSALSRSIILIDCVGIRLRLLRNSMTWGVPNTMCASIKSSSSYRHIDFRNDRDNRCCGLPCLVWGLKKQIIALSDMLKGLLLGNGQGLVHYILNKWGNNLSSFSDIAWYLLSSVFLFLFCFSFFFNILYSRPDQTMQYIMQFSLCELNVHIGHFLGDKLG